MPAFGVIADKVIDHAWQPVCTRDLRSTMRVQHLHADDGRVRIGSLRSPQLEDGGVCGEEERIAVAARKKLHLAVDLALIGLKTQRNICNPGSCPVASWVRARMCCSSAAEGQPCNRSQDREQSLEAWLRTWLNTDAEQIFG